MGVRALIRGCGVGGRARKEEREGRERARKEEEREARERAMRISGLEVEIELGRVGKGEEKGKGKWEAGEGV